MIRFYKLRTDNPQMSKGEAFRPAQFSLLGAGTKAAKSDSDAARSKVVNLTQGKVNLPLFIKDETKPFAHPFYWFGNWR